MMNIYQLREDLSRLKYCLIVFGIFSLLIGSSNLDIDEFTFVREPYEILGGDYTIEYLKQGRYIDAAMVMTKAYFFYWNYRSMWAPIVKDKHLTLFDKEEKEFGYKPPVGSPSMSEITIERYRERLIVPEPGRMYFRGAGKPLLSSLIIIPPLAIVKLLTFSGPDILDYQFNYRYHPIFILVRLSHIIAGFASIIILYRIMIKCNYSRDQSILCACIFSLIPVSIKWFPNIHNDAIMIPFALGSILLFLNRRYIYSGVMFGLCMASKNTAIFLPVALIPIFARQAWQAFNDRKISDIRMKLFNSWLKKCMLIAVATVAVLSIFSNPISFFREIAAPIIGREFDQRVLIREKEAAAILAPSKTRYFSSQQNNNGLIELRPEIALIRKLGLDNFMIFFAIFGIGLIISNKRNVIEQYSIIFLALAWPYQMVFGPLLIWRYLIFLPFWSLLIAALFKKRHAQILIAVLVLIDIVYLIDPVSTDGIHLYIKGNNIADMLRLIIK